MLRRGEGWALGHRVAREYEEDNVHLAIAARNGLVVVGYVAADPARHVHDRHAVCSSIVHINDAVLAVRPLAVSCGVVVTSGLSAVVARERGALSLGPIPAAVDIVVAVGLDGVLVLALHAAEPNVPLASSVVQTRGVAVDVRALLRALTRGVNPLALDVGCAHAGDLVEAASALACAVLPLAVVVGEACRIVEPAADLSCAIPPNIVPLAVCVISADRLVRVVGAKLAA